MPRVAVSRPAAVGRALGKRQIGGKSLDSKYKSTAFCIKKVRPEIFDLFCSLIINSQRRYSELVAHGAPITPDQFGSSRKQNIIEDLNQIEEKLGIQQVYLSAHLTMIAY